MMGNGARDSGRGLRAAIIVDVADLHADCDVESTSCVDERHVQYRGHTVLKHRSTDRE